MSSREQTAERIEALLTERSIKAVELARKVVGEEQIRDRNLKEALRFFIEDFWFNAAHPTLLSLSCQAVGGNPDDTTEIAAALVLLTGAADIHDDVIDQSLTKGPKETVYGKFGTDVAIIAGNVLWLKGMLILEEACVQFSVEKRRAILKLAKEAFFDIGSAEAKEAALKRNKDVQPKEYLEMLNLKVALSEAAAKIGAIVGNGKATEIEALGQYGKTLGLLMTIRDEFIDMFEVDEVKNRFKNECLPLPILYALQDTALTQKLLGIISEENLTEERLEEMIEIVYGASAVRELIKDIQASIKDLTDKISSVTNSEVLVSLLNFTVEDLPAED